MSLKKHQVILVNLLIACKSSPSNPYILQYQMFHCFFKYYILLTVIKLKPLIKVISQAVTVLDLNGAREPDVLCVK